MKLVFVSSTFKDMQFERDLLQTYAIPTLDDALKEYGEKAYFGDLRWGVNTTDLDSDAGSKKVLQVCLDQIDNCKPYMIVLIGERYGWIPAQTLLDEACVLKGIEKVKDISVTELEIDYGALLEPECEGRIMFYFRDLDTTGMTEAELRDYKAESSVHAVKIEDLKRRIREAYPSQIRHYTAKWDPEKKEVSGLEGFLQQVEQDLSDVLLRDLETMNQIPWQERCMRSAENWRQERLKTLHPEGQSDVCYNCDPEDLRFLYLTGEDGSGRSSELMSIYEIRREGEEDYEDRSLYFVLGLDKFSMDGESFFKILLYKLESMLGMAHQEVADYFAAMDLIWEYQEKLEKSLHIYIDDANEYFLGELYFFEEAFTRRYGAFYPMPDFNLSFHIVAREDLPYYPFFPYSVLSRTAPLTREQATQILDKIIRSNHKEIAPAVKERILSKEQSCHASYLRAVVKRLLILDSEDFAAIRAMGDGMENINRYMLNIINETDDDRYSIYMELVDEARDRISAEFTDRLLGLLAFTGMRLNAAEIKGIFGYAGWHYSDLDFSMTVRMLEDVVEYNPSYRNYGIKNQALVKLLMHHIPKVDMCPVVEYMLEDAQLNAYAFAAALYTQPPAYIHSVLLRMQDLKSVPKQFARMVERGQQDKLIQLLVYIAEQGELPGAELIPDEDLFPMAFKKKEFEAVWNFLRDLADQLETRCPPMTGNKPLTPGKRLILEMFLTARVFWLQMQHREDTPYAIDELQKLRPWLEGRYQKVIRPYVRNHFYMTLLITVHYAHSQKLSRSIIGGPQYLDNFVFTTPYEKVVLRLIAYEHYANCFWGNSRQEKAAVAKCRRVVLKLSEELGSFWGEMNSIDMARCAAICQDMQLLQFGKAVFTNSQELLLQELFWDVDSGDAAEAEETEESYDEDDPYAKHEMTILEKKMNRDRIRKARYFAGFCQTVTAWHTLLRKLDIYLTLANLDEAEDVELLGLYFGVMGNMIAQKTLPVRLYAMLPFVVENIYDKEPVDEEGELLDLEAYLDHVQWNEPMAEVVSDFCRCRYAGCDMDDLDAVFQRYLDIRPDYSDTEAVALELMDWVFSNEGYEVP